KALNNVLTELNMPLQSNPTDWVKTFTEHKQVRIEPASVPGNVVPDMSGMGAKDAVYLAERLGLNVQVNGRGKVISQNLKPGIAVRKGSVIKISLQ
ncbi:MAG TPA: PASTA domain-containing protein, partial [Paludibacter sp.]